MLHAPTRLKMFSLGLVAVLGFAACSSDDDASSDDSTSDQTTESTVESTGDTAEVTVPDVSVSTPEVSIVDGGVTLPSGVTLPDGVTIPPVEGLAEECTDYLNLFASAFAGDATATEGLDDAIDDLQAEAPDDLKDDVEVVAEAISELVEISERYQGNPSGLYSDPDALALFSDPAFTDSQQKVTAWLQTECGTS